MEEIKDILWELLMAKCQTEELQLKAVKIDGRYLQYCRNPPTKVQLEAIKTLKRQKCSESS